MSGVTISIIVNLPVGRAFEARRRKGVNRGACVRCLYHDGRVIVYMPRTRYRKHYPEKKFLARYTPYEMRR